MQAVEGQDDICIEDCMKMPFTSLWIPHPDQDQTKVKCGSQHCRDFRTYSANFIFFISGRTPSILETLYLLKRVCISVEDSVDSFGWHKVEQT